jgi:DNA-binding CsgD family transcriptional regulator
VQARDRERQVLELFLRGLSWVQIGRQLGITDMGAIKAFDRAVKRVPAKKDMEMLRKLQSERLNDARRRVYSELAGRQEPDPANPGQMKTIRPTVEQVYLGVDRIVRIEIREANLYGLDAPKKSDILQAFVAVGPPSLTDEEIAIRWTRLTEEEQQTYLRLVAKMDGRWVDPMPIEDQGETVETTATNVEDAVDGEKPKKD